MNIRKKLIKARLNRIKQYETLWLHYFTQKDYKRQHAVMKQITWCKDNINR